MKSERAYASFLYHRQELGKLGLLGMVFPTEYAGAGMGYVEYVIAIEELSRVDGSVGHLFCAAHTSLCSNHILSRRQPNAQKKEIRQQAGYRRIHRRMGVDRAFFRIRRGQRPHDREAPRQRLGSEWHENFLHQRPLRRRDGGDRCNRPRRQNAWAFRLHRRERYQGVPSRQEREQTRAARERHCRDDLRRLRDSSGKSARARKATASSTRCACSTAAASRLPLCRWAWRRALTRPL